MVKVGELIKELKRYDMDQEVEICCYTSIGRPKEMYISYGQVDDLGLYSCQIKKEILGAGLERDSKTVCIY